MEENKDNHLIYSKCRCCLKSGVMKTLWGEYLRNGEIETYGEMLTKCFAISWEQSNTHVEQICMICVSKLRAACDFKRVVLTSEEQLLEYIEEELQPDEKDGIKKLLNQRQSNDNEKIVFEEVLENQDQYYDDQDQDSNMDIYTDIEYLEDDENTEHVNGITQLVEETKRATNMALVIGHTEVTRVQPKASSKINIGEQKPILKVKSNIRKPLSTTEQLAQVARNYKLTSIQEKILERSFHQDNLRCLLLYTNASPLVRRTDRGYVCCYCTERFMDPADLKQHSIEDHDDESKAMCLRDKEMSVFFAKVDITDLRCNICDSNLNTLEEAFEHLKAEHNKPIHLEIKNHIVPFKFEGDGFNCCMCGHQFTFFKTLARHMTSHYKNFQCDVCGVWFINQRFLKVHSLRHIGGSFPCSFCDKVFDARVKRTNHERVVHRLKKMTNTCGVCGAKFNDAGKKNRHLHEVHGQDLPKYKCQGCEKEFVTKKNLTKHIMGYHLKVRRYTCDLCGKEFYDKISMQRHRVIHTNAKDFKCDICFKEFNRKSTLNMHVRIHLDDKRYPCEICGEAFIQNKSRKKHMNKIHGIEE